jgi:hypothetical protein
MPGVQLHPRFDCKCADEIDPGLDDIPRSAIKPQDWL